ncbi:MULTISPECIES: STAS domain-containing protein [Streptomyces]|jgi:hypothetical protein|uniref:hypothetical protein n=1 Tax=Streptomyces TaxID=1883 RepID=UPI0035ABD382
MIVARNHVHTAHAAVPDHTLRVLRLVGLDQIFPHHPDSDAARQPRSARSGGTPMGEQGVSAVCALGSWVRDGNAKPPTERRAH